MRCPEVQEQLSYYDYGGLSWWRRWRIGRHLARCSDCTRELALLRRTAEALTLVPDRPAPERLWERVWEGVQTEQALRRQEAKVSAAQPLPWRGRWAPVGGAAMAVLLIALGLFWAFGPRLPRADVFDNPTPFVHYHHLLAQQELMADAAGLDVLALAVRHRAGGWEQEE